MTHAHCVIEILGAGDCNKFGKLILRKIIKTIATRCHILRLNASNSISSGAPPQTPVWGSTQTPLGELTALHQTP